MTVLDIISVEYPQMAALSNISNWIARAESKTNRGYFTSSPTAGDEAVAYRAMHMYAVSPASKNRPLSEAGTITGKAEGGLSLQFGQTSSSYRNDNLDQTAFGKALKELIRIQTPAIGMVGVPTINRPLPPEMFEADQIADDFFNTGGGHGHIVND